MVMTAADSKYRVASPANSGSRRRKMPQIKFYNRRPVPMEMHKVKIVQKLTLLPAKERLAKEEQGRWRLTPRGFLVSNAILVELLDAQQRSIPLAKKR